MNFRRQSADDPRFFLGLMTAREWSDLERAAHYAYAEDERMAELYRRGAGYDREAIYRDPR